MNIPSDIQNIIRGFIRKLIHKELDAFLFKVFRQSRRRYSLITFGDFVLLRTSRKKIFERFVDYLDRTNLNFLIKMNDRLFCYYLGKCIDDLFDEEDYLHTCRPTLNSEYECCDNMTTIRNYYVGVRLQDNLIW